MYFQLSLAKRQILLLETLKVKQTILEPIPSSLKLLVSVTCYWLQHTEAKAKLHHLQALLLGMLMGPLHVINSPGRYLEIPGVKFCILLAYNHKFKQMKKHSWIVYSHRLYPELRGGDTKLPCTHWQMFLSTSVHQAQCCSA